MTAVGILVRDMMTAVGILVRDRMTAVGILVRDRMTAVGILVMDRMTAVGILVRGRRWAAVGSHRHTYSCFVELEFLRTKVHATLSYWKQPVHINSKRCNIL